LGLGVLAIPVSCYFLPPYRLLLGCTFGAVFFFFFFLVGLGYRGTNNNNNTNLGTPTTITTITIQIISIITATARAAATIGKSLKLVELHFVHPVPSAEVDIVYSETEDVSWIHNDSMKRK
jgi:hypothetical protein